MKQFSFISPRDQKLIHAPLGDSLIHGTLNNADLIPEFLAAIRETRDYDRLLKDPDNRHFVELAANDDYRAPEWDSEAAILLYEALYDILNGYAPDGYVFDTYPGNDSDFGYWSASLYE